VPRHSPGLTVREDIELIAPHPIGTVLFEGCRVPASCRLGAEGEGFMIAMANLDRFRATVGAAAVGFARRALDEAARYAQERVQFGRPLSEFEGIQFKLAEMATKLEASRLLVERAASSADRSSSGDAPAGYPISPFGEDASREASMAKLFASEAAQEIVDEAVQIHGGRGLVRGAVVEHLYREVRALRIYEGTSEIQRTIIARSLLA
jgi:acyl-CoA dehydrogenase